MAHPTAWKFLLQYNPQHVSSARRFRMCFAQPSWRSDCMSFVFAKFGIIRKHVSSEVRGLGSASTTKIAQSNCMLWVFRKATFLQATYFTRQQFANAFPQTSNSKGNKSASAQALIADKYNSKELERILENKEIPVCVCVDLDLDLCVCVWVRRPLRATRPWPGYRRYGLRAQCLANHPTSATHGASIVARPSHNVTLELLLSNDAARQMIVD